LDGVAASGKNMKKAEVIDSLLQHFAEEALEARERGDEQQLREVERQVLMYRHLPRREHEAQAIIVPPSLVQVELRGVQSWLLLVPGGGGLVTRVAGAPIQVVTPQSPLGERLLGRREGEEVRVRTGSGEREYRILTVR
jgi:hypothetical protein